MNLGVKEKGSGQVCFYGASLGLRPWVRLVDDVYNCFVWIGISLLVCPWDPSMQTFVVLFYSIVYVGYTSLSLLCQFLASLPSWPGPLLVFTSLWAFICCLVILSLGSGLSFSWKVYTTSQSAFRDVGSVCVKIWGGFWELFHSITRPS